MDVGRVLFSREAGRQLPVPFRESKSPPDDLRGASNPAARPMGFFAVA